LSREIRPDYISGELHLHVFTYRPSSQFAKIASMPPSDIDELFAQTLRGAYDDDAPWKAVNSLRRIGTRQVFETAVSWIESPEPLVRARGLDVLAQLGKTAQHRSNTFPQECYAVVSEALQRERDPQPLSSAVSALGHLHDARGIPLIAAFDRHPAAEIRFSVACALGSFPNDPLSIETLLRLMEDTDDDVRDWATFGVGVLGDRDSAEIRDALYRKLNDRSADVREEALVGLAKRHDARSVPVLVDALEQPSMTDRIIEVAYTLLDLEDDQKGRSAQDYVSALRQRFSQ
jgi:HEAT repeat protein